MGIAGVYPQEVADAGLFEAGDKVVVIRGNYIFALDGNGLPRGGGVVVVDNLTSISTTNALSANQGRVLKGEIDTKCPLVGGKVPSANLPSYIDDILEYANLASFPLVGEKVKIYSALDTNLFYRWSGSTYALIGDGTSVDVIGIGSNSFARYDIVQTLTDADKSRFLNNVGGKRSGNLITKTAPYTLQLSDFKNDIDLYDVVYLRMNSATANNITIDTTLSSLPNLAEINIRNVGVGLSTLVATGTTLNGNLAFTTQHEVKTLVKVGENEWDVIGGVT